MDLKLSICVPVYNEAENLPLLHQEIVKAIDPAGISAEIILVDDGSTDGSWRAIESLVAKDPRVRGIKFKSNCG
ncbi:MAG: glycosyltransferase, partial [Tepidisphaeraceae bacterium]